MHLLNCANCKEVVPKYPKSSRIENLTPFYMAFKKLKQLKKGEKGRIPDSFHQLIERAKRERDRQTRQQYIVVDDETSTYTLSSRTIVLYRIVGSPCLELQKLIPKGDYSLVIVDIPYDLIMKDQLLMRILLHIKILRSLSDKSKRYQ